jgi:Txe/YoeB family toxin of Txe-Axe toxin-antitoxin module
MDGAMSNFRLCVIDDFYPDPAIVRQYALSLPFKEIESSAEKTFYKGHLTQPQHGYSQLGLELIAAQLRKLIYWNMPTGEFRLIFERAKDDPDRKTWIHFDSMVTRYAAIVYLNEPEQCEGGTAFYRHRETGWDNVPDLGSGAWQQAEERTKKEPEALLKTFQSDGFEVDSKWEQLSVVPMRFNRCIVFDSRQFHARLGGFGQSTNDGRLTQNFFFDVAP